MSASASSPSTSSSSNPSTFSMAALLTLSMPSSSLTAGSSFVDAYGSVSPIEDDLTAALEAAVEQTGSPLEQFLTGSVNADTHVTDSPFGTPDQFFQSLAHPSNDWPKADALTCPLTPELSSDFALPKASPCRPSQSFNSALDAMFNEYVQEPEAFMLGHSGYSSTHSSPLSEQLDTPVQSPVMPAVEVEMPLVTDLPSELLQAVITTLTTQSKVTQVAAQNSPPPVSTPVAVGASSGHGSSGSYNRPVPPSRPIIPFDAPIQPRQYITPSATSRRDAPSLKRKADDMEDPDEMDEIAKKRLQNTMAARRSRQRKRNELKELQDTLASITAERDQAVRERDEWKAYALKMQEYARRLGAPLPGMPSN